MWRIIWISRRKGMSCRSKLNRALIESSNLVFVQIAAFFALNLEKSAIL